MALECVGGHWLHPDRTLYGNRACDVELMYIRNGTPGFDWSGVPARVAQIKAKGNVDVWLRLDWKPGQVVPAMNDDAGVYDYVQGVQQAVAQMGSNLRGIICGNEPNLHSEVGGHEVQPWWIGRVVYGHTLAGNRTDNCFQFARSARPGIQVLAPAIAPWSGDSGGDISGLVPPDGRSGIGQWEGYQYDMARSCYQHDGHVPDISDIQFAIHTYGRVGPTGAASNGALDPWYDNRGATYYEQRSSRWFQDAIYYMRKGMLNSPYGVDYYPPVLVSEANTYVDGYWPRDNYPGNAPWGWARQLARYVDQFPNVMGLAFFVDQDYGGGWGGTAVTAGQGREPTWNRDLDNMLSSGWR